VEHGAHFLILYYPPNENSTTGTHTLMSQHQLHRTVSLIRTVNGNTVRSFSTHGQPSAAQGSSTNVSRSENIRLIQHFDSSALGLVRRLLLIGYFPIHSFTPPPLNSARAEMTALPRVDTKCTTPSRIPTVNGNTVRSLSTHGQQSAAKGSSTTVSRSDIRLI
jgi:hypothetical protein